MLLAVGAGINGAYMPPIALCSSGRQFAEEEVGFDVAFDYGWCCRHRKPSVLADKKACTEGLTQSYWTSYAEKIEAKTKPRRSPFAMRAVSASINFEKRRKWAKKRGAYFKIKPKASTI